MNSIAEFVFGMSENLGLYVQYHKIYICLSVYHVLAAHEHDCMYCLRNVLLEKCTYKIVKMVNMLYTTVSYARQEIIIIVYILFVRKQCIGLYGIATHS